MILLGLILIVLGIFNCSRNISTIHWYHRRKVSEKDRPAYGKWMGSGIIVCGAGLILGRCLQFFTLEVIWTLPVIAGLAAGIGMMLYAQFRYNHGIF